MSKRATIPVPKTLEEYERMCREADEAREVSRAEPIRTDDPDPYVAEAIIRGHLVGKPDRRGRPLRRSEVGPDCGGEE